MVKKKKNYNNIINKHPSVYTALECTLRQVSEGNTQSLNKKDRTGIRPGKILKSYPAKDGQKLQLSIPRGGYSAHETDFISKSKPQNSPDRKGGHSDYRCPSQRNDRQY